MRRFLHSIWVQTTTGRREGEGGVISSGAKPVSGYTEPPKPPNKPPSGGGSGHNNGGSGSGSSGSGGGGQLRITRDQLAGFGFDETTVNAFSESAVLNGRLADYINAVARAQFEERNPGKKYIDEHMPGEFVFSGPNDPQSDSLFGRVYKNKGDPKGDYYFSKQEFQKMAQQLRFHFDVADNTVQVTVHRMLALPGEPLMEDRFKKNPRTHAVDYNINQGAVPQYVTDARARLGNVFEITVSHTTGGAQQTIVPEADKNMQYGEEKPILGFLKWLGDTKFKP